MTRSNRRDLLSPGEMFPGRDPTYRVSFPRLQSGLTVRIIERGDPGAEPVLFVHGWGCTVYVFSQMMPVIADAGFRAIAVDLKGHGLSDKPLASTEYSVESLVEHVRDICDTLGLESPALVGHSLGGSLSYHFAARYRDRVRCLALLSPVGLEGVPLMWLYRALTPRFLNPVLARVKSRSIVEIALRRVYGRRGTFSARDVDEFLAPWQLPDYAPALRELLHTYDWRVAETRSLKKVDVPAVGLWGAIDHLMPVDGMKVYVPLLPRVVLHEIPEAGHVIPLETPDEVDAAVLTLLGGK